jgi:hypothetical protein
MSRTMLRPRTFTHITLVGSLLCLAGGCNHFLGHVLVGSGVSVTESRETESFDALNVSGAMTANVTIGEPPSIEITADDNILPLVVTEFRDGSLVIRLNHRGRLRMNEGITVTIVTPELRRVEVSGACQVEIAEVATEEFVVNLRGASQLAANGICERLVADVSGASKLECEDLASVSAQIDASGASKAYVTANESLFADASGASSIRYSGNPADVQVDKSGVASISAIQNDAEESAH